MEMLVSIGVSIKYISQNINLDTQNKTFFHSTFMENYDYFIKQWQCKM